MTRVPSKPAFHPTFTQSTAAPATPPKKGAALGRGVPPPIPPNKPVIPSKQTPSRRPESSELDKKKPSLPTSKDPAAAPPAAGDPTRPAQGIEMLGQELADFQQMFVTMATSNNT